MDDVVVRWIDGDPPPSTDRAPTLRHRRIAAALKQQPGRWAEVPGLETQWAHPIKTGSNAAYRPGGSFEAVGRRGVVYARYVGGG